MGLEVPSDGSEGVAGGDALGVFPVEGGSWSRRSDSVFFSNFLRAARRDARSSAQLEGQEGASVECDLARDRSSRAVLELEIPRLTEGGRKLL